MKKIYYQIERQILFKLLSCCTLFCAPNQKKYQLIYNGSYHGENLIVPLTRDEYHYLETIFKCHKDDIFNIETFEE